MEKTISELNEITRHLLKVDPYKIILFGSAVENTMTDNSDIDLLVILDIDSISQNYKERMEKKLLVRRSIYNISKRIPIDLLVYTKAEYEIIQKNKNSFFKNIDQTGKVLYEKAS